MLNNQPLTHVKISLNDSLIIRTRRREFGGFQRLLTFRRNQIKLFDRRFLESFENVVAAFDSSECEPSKSRKVLHFEGFTKRKGLKLKIWLIFLRVCRLLDTLAVRTFALQRVQSL